jgi:uncharacterized membrane protein YfcA
MDLHHILLLLAAGIAGGVISSMVGGAAMVTYPALLATGLSPILAVAANLVALCPGNLLAALADRRQLPPLDRSFVGLVLASLGGAAVGAVLLLLTPDHLFERLVPLLLGFATILFALSPRITAWLRRRAEAQGADERHWGQSIPVLLPVSIYGGYFGAGVGVLLLGVLSVGTPTYRAANVTKNLVTSLNSVVASAIFIERGVVTWGPTLAMMAGALVGSLLGGQLAKILPNFIARVLVISVGTLLTVIFAERYWF